MTQLRALPTSLAATASLFLFALAPRIAHAESTCAASSDCDKGFECVVVGSGSCPGAPACAPNGDCPQPAPCMVTEEKACVPAHCSSDAQCADGMVCHAWDAPCAVTSCACPPDQENCDCAPVPECANETESLCTPRYVLPCETATDCGEGFTCEEQISEICADTAGAPAMDPSGAAPAPPQGSGGSSAELPAPDPIPEPRTCTPEPSGRFACVPKMIECSASSDCPTGWLCQQEVPTSAAPGCDGCPEDSAKPAPEPAPVPAPRLCRPEYASAVDSAGQGSGEVLTSGNASGSPGGVPPRSPQPENAADGAGSNESSACQMGHAPASQSALSVLAMLGALVGLKRRRR